MKNLQTQALARISKGKVKLILGIVAVAIIFGLTIFGSTSSSRFSTPAEIAAHEEFQSKLMTAQMEFYQKIELATKEAEQKSDSISEMLK